jgi:O-antigen/teichoic acid export membrane protein
VGIVKKQSINLSIVSYIGVLIGYINKVLLFPRFLNDPAQVGLANTLISVALLYAQFSALGMNGVILKFFPFFQDKERKHHGFLYWTSLIVTIGFLVTTLGFLLLKPWVITKFSANSPLLVENYYYLIPLGFATLFFTIYDSYLRSLLKVVVPSFINEVYIRLMATLSISLFALHLVNFKQFVFIYVILNCSHALILAVYIIYLKQWSYKPIKSFRIKTLRYQMFYFGLFAILSSAGNSIISNIDGLMIASLLKNGLYYTGIYTTVFFISTIIFIPYRSIIKITSPLVSTYWKDNDMAKMESLYKKVTVSNMLIGGFIFLLLWINIDNILSFLPKEYHSGKYVFLFVSLGRLFDMITGLNAVITVTSKKYKYDLFFTGFLIILTLVSNYVFIVFFHLGIEGAALASMITLFTYNILRLIFVQYNFKMQPFTMNCIWILVLGIICLGISLLIPRQTNVIVDGLCRSIPIGIVYGVTSLYFKLSTDLNDFFYEIFPKFKWLKR